MLKYAKSIVVEEGNYYVATNPTIGTAVTYSLQTNLSATQACMVWANTSSNTGAVSGKTIVIDRIRLMLAPGKVAPVGSSVVNFYAVVDTTNRAATAGQVTVIPKNVNLKSSAISQSNFTVFSTGQVQTVPASSTTTTPVAYGTVVQALQIAGDEYVIQFGSADECAQNGYGGAARTQPSKFVAHAGPFIIPPGYWGVFYLWGPTWATNQPCFEYEVSWWEI